VIVEEHDIFGDGVNVAARLEALAKPADFAISLAAVRLNSAIAPSLASSVTSDGFRSSHLGFMYPILILGGP
jgi:class 3 adenylate cyclase